MVILVKLLQLRPGLLAKQEGELQTKIYLFIKSKQDLVKQLHRPEKESRNIATLQGKIDNFLVLGHLFTFSIILAVSSIKVSRESGRIPCSA
jgi:hypothetical protein